MSSPHSHSPAAPLNLSCWRNVPNGLIAVGGVLALVGAFVDYRQFNFSWLFAFMFFLSLGVGGLFLTLAHHLFDASWSVPIRRVNEHLMCLLPIMGLLFIPIAINVAMAPDASILYGWMKSVRSPGGEHALHAKLPLFTKAGFFIVAAFNFFVWWLLSSRLRGLSLEQDKTGSAACTEKMRLWSYVGIFLFALTVTLGVIMWVKALQHEWFSTMFGVYYFAESVWITLATVYVLTALLQRTGHLKDVIKPKQYYFLGSLLFAFTVFYSYIHFSQYFIIWNANLPEETFWYVLREQGSWKWAGITLIFGHFFIPFLTLLRIDVKHNLTIMVPVFCWAVLMHFLDQAFNIVPVLHPEGVHINWMDFACFALIGGVLAKVFIANFNAHAPYPQRDPRLAEGLDIYVPPASAAKAK